MLPLEDQTPTGVPPTTPPMAPPAPTPPPAGPPPAMPTMAGAPAPPAQAPPAPVPPQVASNVRHNMLGRAVSSLMGNQVQYQTDPNTGATVAVPAKGRPGDLWRHIVAGAILGGAVGGGETGGGGGGGEPPTPLQRFFGGAQASMAQGQNQDKERYARAQENAKAQLENKRVNQELLFQQAQIAHMHQEDLRANMQMDLFNPQQIARDEEIMDNREAQVKAAKGQLTPLMVDGQNINGMKGNYVNFMKAHGKDPQAFNTPDMVHVHHVDTSGLHYELGQGWVDDKGQSVDLATRTTHLFYKVPENAMTQPLPPPTHKQMNKILPYKAFPDDDNPIQGTLNLGDWIKISGDSVKQLNESAETQVRLHLAVKESNMLSAELGRIAATNRKEDAAEDNAKFERLRQYNQELMTQKKELDTTASAGVGTEAAQAVADSKAIQAQINANNQALNAFMARGKTPIVTAPPKGAGAGGSGEAPTVDKTTAGVVSDLSRMKYIPKDYSDAKTVYKANSGVDPSPDQIVDLYHTLNQPIAYSDVVDMAADYNALWARQGLKANSAPNAPLRSITPPDLERILSTQNGIKVVHEEEPIPGGY